jgi:hypothetical protein
MARVQHLVLLRFKEGTSAQTIAECFTAVAELPKKIPGIDYYASGPNCSPEGLNKGFTHAFVMTFASAAARDQYLPHPEHEKVKAMLFRYLEEGLAFDFEEGGHG